MCANSTEHDMAPSPKVSIIILNWNGWKDTLECLQSVQKINYPNFRVLVVDNGSSDESVAQIRQAFPDVALLETGKNLGYAGGNNAGIAQVLNEQASFILLLNNDTVVPPDLLSAFINAVNILPAGTILGAKIYFYDKPDTIWFAGGRWDSESNSFEHIGHGQPDATEFNSVAEIDYITGCALFASAETFNEVGLLDERYFLTYEETDWCYRARARGHKCIFVPDAKLWHKVSSSFGGASSPLFTYFMVRNKPLWAKDYLPLSSRFNMHKEDLRILLRTLLPPFSFVKTDLPLVKNLLWSTISWLKTIKRNINNPTNRATLMGLRDYYLGRLGNCPDQVRELAKTDRSASNSSKFQ